MSYYPDLGKIKEILKTGDYKSIPLTLTLDTFKETMDIYKILKNISKNVFVLESCEDRENFGRYSFLGFDPTLDACPGSPLWLWPDFLGTKKKVTGNSGGLKHISYLGLDILKIQRPSNSTQSL